MKNVDVYISYHNDSASHITNAVVSELEAQGVRCWYAPRDVSNDYAGDIVSAISSCRVFLLMLNKEASESAHVLNEVDFATNRLRKGEEITIVPFHLDGNSISDDAKYYLGRLHWVDGNTPPTARRIRDLVEHIVKLLNEQGQETKAPVTYEPVRVKPYDGDASFIFVSYAHKNKESVLPIIAELQRRGFRVWYDEGIDPGTEWDDFIAARIEECGYMIAFISREYLESDNCKDELNFARDLGKKRLLVYLEDVALPRGMAMRLNRLQAIHKHKYSYMDQFMDKLISADALEEFRDE